MKIPKILSIVLLAVLCIPLFSSNSIPQFLFPGSIHANTIKGVEPVPPLPELPHRIIPVSILVYSQFADNTPGEEVENMFAAINSTYGTNYYWTNLTDYTNLASELPYHDILLIPEQEYAYYANMTSVATAWSTTLTNWVNDGGIVICADGRSVPEADYTPTARIYNETGLMTFYGSAATYPVTINLVNTSDALARGVPGSWTSASMTVNFDTPDQTVVVDDGTYPIVIHKIVGKGHVVLIGYDYYSSEINMEMILGNAIRLHRHVVFDNSHGQSNDIFSYWTDWADDLVAENFAVSSMNTFNPDFFAASNVLIISTCTVTYTVSDVAAIEQFVAQGGGLFFVGDFAGNLEEIKPVAQEFGFNIEGASYIEDTDEYTTQLSYVIYGSGNVMNHSLTFDVSTVQHFTGTGIISQPAHAQSIIVTDIDGTADWQNGTPADGVPILSAMTYHEGRVVISTDFNWLRVNQNADGDGTDDYYDEDNEILAVNTIRWLSAAGLKERIVLFEESHGANFYFDASYSGLSEFLTDNGYTIKWMDTFYPSLINQADVLILCDGSVAYSGSEITTITDFVAGGGGLFLVGGESIYGAEVDPIGNAFGIDRNDTGYITDSDDYSAVNSYVIYNSSNFGTHPITQGLTRLEMIMSSAFDTIGSATALLWTDGDGTSTWSDGGPANSVPIAVALAHQLGRVFYSADYRFCRTGYDMDGDGVYPLYEHDNILYVQNIFQWLSENRAPVVTVTSPNGGEMIEGATNTITWTAQDPNKDSMTYDILYSINGGGSWTPIATDHTTTSINWDATSIPESLDALIRVVAHDYELSGQDDSDAVFSVESEGPQISNIQTNPAVPLASIPVTVSADIIDASGVASAVCQVSTDGGSIWTDFSMTLVSGTTYEANIGVFASGTVQYRITATDSSAASRTRTSSISSFTIAALPPVIPGFPIEAIVLAFAAGLGFFLLIRRRRRTVSS